MIRRNRRKCARVRGLAKLRHGPWPILAFLLFIAALCRSSDVLELAVVEASDAASAPLDDPPPKPPSLLAGHFAEAERQLRFGRPAAADRVLMSAQPLLGDDPHDTARYLLLRGHVHRHFGARLPRQLKKAAELFEDALEVTKGDALLESRIQQARASLCLKRARELSDPG